MKSLSLGLSSVLLAGAFATAAPSQAGPVAGSGAPFDLAMVNDDRLIDALVQRGEIPAGLARPAQEEALGQYLSKRAQGATNGSNLKQNSRAAKAERLRREAGLNTGIAPAEAQAWGGGLQVDKILVLLVDYSDYAHNSIQPEETDMYYPQYTKEHYEQMIFGDSGYTGPNGENLISMRQYYLQQSGGSYTVEGGVHGWYTLPQTAAWYGGNDASGNDARPRNAVYHALQTAVANGVNLADYDQEDLYDLDGDGDLREPDGLVDHLMVIHAGVGEEAGGGSLGADAIWSHRWDLGGVYTFNSPTSVPYWGGKMGAFDYTIEPEDGATGVFAHEFGHDLGYPDEYDTTNVGSGEPVQYWSIMAGGSWAGTVAGTEPTGFSPRAKEFLQSRMPGSNWLHGATVELAEIPKGGLTFTLDQASTKGANHDVVRINLPDQVANINTPASGSYEYWGGTGDEHDHSMVASVDLTGATSATLEFDLWYDIESNWDFGFVQVWTNGGGTWTSLSTANTTSVIDPDGYPTIMENLPGYTGSSGGWLHESIDLSPYAGQEILVQFRSMSDWASNLAGLYVDNVAVTVDGTTVLNDGAEGAPAFALHGFAKDQGTIFTPHYYLVEWRNHAGVDQGLAHIPRGQSNLSNDPGMLVWYVNGAYEYNHTSIHPGYGFVGVVDAHQNVHHWGGNVAKGVMASSRYQIFDATFSLKKGADMDLYYGQGQHIHGEAKSPVATFDDSRNWWSPSSPASGVKIPTYGLKITVTGEASDRSAATIHISK